MHALLKDDLSRGIAARDSALDDYFIINPKLILAGGLKGAETGTLAFAQGQIKSIEAADGRIEVACVTEDSIAARVILHFRRAFLVKRNETVDIEEVGIATFAGAVVDLQVETGFKSGRQSDGRVRGRPRGSGQGQVGFRTKAEIAGSDRLRLPTVDAVRDRKGHGVEAVDIPEKRIADD